jgi:hypothetical protein
MIDISCLEHPDGTVYLDELIGNGVCSRCKKKFIDFADDETCSYSDCDRMEYPKKDERYRNEDNI